jgi:hypothetical protein
MLDVDLLITSAKPLSRYKPKIKTKPIITGTSLIEEPKVKLVRKPNTSKAKGNSFENKMAKMLGIWIFKDKDMLTRSLTSGAIKSVYIGDIVPQKPFGWDSFVFNFECKSGYSHNIPNFINYTKIEDWLKKCLKERTLQQPIIWLICGFHNYEVIVITDLEMTLKSNLLIKVEGVTFYVYKLKELMQYNFYSLYANNLKLLEVFNLPEKGSNNDK